MQPPNRNDETSPATHCVKLAYSDRRLTIVKITLDSS